MMSGRPSSTILPSPTSAFASSPVHLVSSFTPASINGVRSFALGLIIRGDDRSRWDLWSYRSSETHTAVGRRFNGARSRKREKAFLNPLDWDGNCER